MPSPKRAARRSVSGDGRRASRTPAKPAKTRVKATPTSEVFSLSPSSTAMQHRLLETITEAVMNGGAPEDVAGACLEVILEVTGAQRAVVYLEDERTKELQRVAEKGVSGSNASVEWDRVIRQAADDGVRIAGPEYLICPLKRAGHLHGVLLLQGLPRAKSADRGLEELIEIVGSRLALGLNHARLAQKYAQKIVRIRHLEEVSEILNSSHADQNILHAAMTAAIKLVEADAGSLLLLDELQNELRFAVVIGEKSPFLGEIKLAIGQGIAGLVAQTGQPVIVNDAQHDPRVALEVDCTTGYTTQTLLAVPVRMRDRTLGVMEAVNKRGGRTFSNWDLMEFTSMANQVAIAIDNSRLLHNYQGKIKRLEKFKEISQVLNSTLNQNEIRKRAIGAATALMDAEAGSLLLLDAATNELYFDVALGEKGEGVRQIRLKVGQGIAGHVAQTGQPVIINDVYSDPRFNREGDKKSGFRTRNMVCVPVKARDKLLGVLQAINRIGGGLFEEDDLQDFISLGNQVGIAIENANLYEEINKLFEGFIAASVTAIESRDPTTSGHSGRVATLCCATAELVDRVDSGPYRDVTFDFDQLKELRYAAVLHDFGKVGVREHVLVKAEKLMPVDLAMLKARFDFIKRTLEVKALQKKVDLLMSGDREATAALVASVDEELARQIAETDGILEFLLACNRPTVLAQGGFERLNDIAKMTYDHFSDSRSYLTPTEAITLSIPKGSLTTEERLEIESHVTHTYRFLSTIPWAKTLKNVPIIAYGHHEKLDGSGYPRQAPGNTLPVQTRIMTICDIFDALSASDRPYKSAVPTPKALAILEDEMKHGKLDGDLLRIFIDGKVYLKVKPS
jgi:HD-GYP domain-containing protein (c-di-GMP phosphodiesterase class II)